MASGVDKVGLLLMIPAVYSNPQVKKSMEHIP